MRFARRRESREEEDSVFVTMTDLTVSFLFVLMVLVVFLATRIGARDAVPIARHEAVVAERDAARGEAEALARRVAGLEADLDRATLRDRAIRDRLAQELEDAAANLNARFPDARVRALRDVLRFEGEGIFARGRWDIAAGRRAIVEALAEELGGFLPCLTQLPEAEQAECGPDRPFAPVVETVLVEGHTDTTGTEAANLDLSTRRALTTFAAVVERVPRLARLRNAADQSLLGVAGYGWQRPAWPTGPGTDEPRNCRIDIRFILVTGGAAP